MSSVVVRFSKVYKPMGRLVLHSSQVIEILKVKTASCTCPTPYRFLFANYSVVGAGIRACNAF